MKTTRCTTCASEFTDDELVGVSSCPSCKTTGLPMDISQDTTININWHELRILTIWATNWAEQACGKMEQRALESIIKRLQAQRKQGWPALTILGEIKELPEALKEQGIECSTIELYAPDGDRLYPPKPKIHQDEA